MNNKYIVVLITVPSKEVGKKISERLLGKKLVACVNVVGSIKSLYTWGNKVCEDDEFLLICKSKMSLFKSELVPSVNELHPYDVPEIIALPIILGNESYLDWIEENTK